MKKIICFILFFMINLASSAQVSDSTSISIKPTKAWDNKGSFKFILNQSSYSNWVAGGDNNIGGNVMLNYNMNYKRGPWTWNSRIMAAFGLSKTADKNVKKTDDKIEINSVLGYKAGGRWSYSFFTNIKTQFTKGYKDYNADPLVKISDFLSPGYFYFGPGMLWKESDDFYLNLSPATSRVTVVKPEQSGNFSVEEGKTLNYEFGFNATLYYKFEIIDNIYFENILTLYADYLKEFNNALIDYQLNVTMKVNKYISTNLNIEIVSDSNASSKIQTKQLFGLGLNIGL
ncbi:DUF3078 domain-containing protein [Aureivirga sp. CE67]|uniref:DUF3078 domain-containing protein n=1 Tax=Aureivirga sp. CE67 TaxID=1788983 RepID=UPI0018CB7736|nr:DUF3078 domain-containing protein [Aureivirga sp. CE67]